MTGRAICVVAPSGAGKDTLLMGALAARPDLHLVQRVITRPTSAGGEGFEGVDEAEFDRRLANGGFSVWWRAHGLKYGLPTDMRKHLAEGETVIFNGSRDALPEIKSAFPDLAVLLITAPKALLRQRLMARGRETPEDIETRLARSVRPAPEGAVTVVNDQTIDEGVARLLAAVDQVSQSEQSA